MSKEVFLPPGFWRTVFLLLRNSRQRAIGRQTRQQELWRQRTGRKTSGLQVPGLALVVMVFFSLFLHVGAAFIVYQVVLAGERLDAERTGKIVVSPHFMEWLKYANEKKSQGEDNAWRQYMEEPISHEADRNEREYGENSEVVKHKLRQELELHDGKNFVADKEAVPGMVAFARPGSVSTMLGSFVLIWWIIMMIFQGEGLQLDLQQRHHPMWEWLFSHPVKPGAIFLAEMLSPIAANPVYLTSPLFVGFLYGFVYNVGGGFIAALLIGIPLSVALACLGKALEIAIVLRFASRTRGAMIGIMSWLGYATFMLFVISWFSILKILGPIAVFLAPLANLPWPWLSLMLGAQSDGSFNFAWGLLFCWGLSALILIISVWFSIWGAQQGLSGNFGQADSAPRRSASPMGFGKEPLYRKEYLWFIRDRSAIVQTILIPVTVASFQLFNMRGLIFEAQTAWNYLCGGAILFGTYFLWTLGPKSLASEGGALWIALTWPRGLENLLKAKAWLWAMISTGVVALVLIYDAFLYPTQIWKITLVGIGWMIFSRSMAEKTITLVTVPSSSGEVEKIPAGRRWAASLGMLTFSVGILTQQWHVAITGIVYSYITAAAMWENFRARLPYLYDPWSEKVPPPPTLMNAMIGISILVECCAILTGTVMIIVGRENMAIAQVVTYGACAIAVSLGMINYLRVRGVSLRDVWWWKEQEATFLPRYYGDEARRKSFLLSLLTGVTAGLVLGAFALSYLIVLTHIPYTAELMRQGQEQAAKFPGLWCSYAIIAIGFAPFSEEYLFRGLLYRALDREWGGWAAVFGSAAFFAIYHPVLSWLPVGLLGVANALLFKNTGRLAPSVALHMIYNTVVVLWQ